jgi:predicted DNA-binding helix-hairpin-helix protein
MEGQHLPPIQKLTLFGEHMALEPDEESAPPAGPLPCGVSPSPRRDKREHLPIANLTRSDGRKIPVLKTMLTSACERNCYYCPFRAGRNYQRATFRPEEMAKTFTDIHRAGLVEGLFLSSGVIKGGVATQDRLLDTADILRNKMGYRGYLHLKLMPGAERDQVERAMQLASRVSVNLEAPNSHRLGLLAPTKRLVEELLQPLRWADEIRRTQLPHKTWNGRWPSTVTQFVVGAVGESDLELLTTTGFLYNRLRLRRAYFSAFRPIADTPLDHLPPTDPWREHRLYQASFLLRDYGFDLEELPFSGDGNLPLHSDPKLAWAQQTLISRPVELNRADREQLLRVPGIGPQSADAILRARRQRTLRDLSDLRRLGIVTKRVAPYVLLNGRRPPQQLPLFP